MSVTVIQARMRMSRALVEEVLSNLGAATPGTGPLLPASSPSLHLFTNVSPVDWETSLAGFDTPDYGGYDSVALGASTIQTTLSPPGQAYVANPPSFQHDGSDTVGSTITGCYTRYGDTGLGWFFNFETPVPLAEEGDTLQIVPIFPLMSQQ